eukprot:PhF_6_TR37695/c0_g1_i2/m.56108/K14648/ENDOU, PP11; poly(U)-specific endoribonuclease
MSEVSPRELLEACDALWDTDVNRMVLGTDLVIHMEGQKFSANDHSDRCDKPFFTSVCAEKFKLPTYAKFIALLDNYIPICGQAEQVTAQEKKEEVDFIEAIFPTKPIQFCWEFLKKHNKAPTTPNEFKKFLHAMWFGLYRRTSGGPLDSSGFEHVFVGEIKNGEVSGCHNWIQIYLEEKKKNLNYKGFFLGRGRGAKAPVEPYIVTMQFDWHGVEKKVGSTLLGVSPEFEMALYTMCFMCGTESNLVELGDFRVVIVCHEYNHGKNIGTCYPETPRA